jgi:hypothetical protein
MFSSSLCGFVLVLLRASRLVHVSGLIGRPMQCYVRFVICGGERARREQKVIASRKKLPYEITSQLLYMQLIIFFILKN